MPKLSELPDSEAAKILIDAYRGACDNYDSELHGPHPSKAVTKWLDIASSGGTNSERDIQQSQDDQQPEITAGGNSGAGGKEPTMDGARRMSKALGKNYSRLK